LIKRFGTGVTYGRLFLVAVLVALGWSGWNGVELAREAGRRSTCSCRLKQIGLGLQNYADGSGCFPAAYTLHNAEPAASWRVQLLPMFGEQTLYERYRLQEPWDSAVNRRLADDFAARASSFRCPSASADQPLAFTNFMMPVGAGAISDGPQARLLKEVSTGDGTSNTLAVVEMAPTDIYWNEPRDLPLNRMSFRLNAPTAPSVSSRHPGGATVVFADGHTQFLSDDISPAVLRALITVHGNDAIGPEF
jgi:prepilin-type processing-associated H-X9-DG protein